MKPRVGRIVRQSEVSPRASLLLRSRDCQHTAITRKSRGTSTMHEGGFYSAELYSVASKALQSLFSFPIFFLLADIFSLSSLESSFPPPLVFLHAEANRLLEVVLAVIRSKILGFIVPAVNPMLHSKRINESTFYLQI